MRSLELLRVQAYYFFDSIALAAIDTAIGLSY